jgi:thymidine kinase
MSKLRFFYGPMNSSKTIQMLTEMYNYRTQNKRVILLKPSCDIRFEEQSEEDRFVRSRINIIQAKIDELIYPTQSRLESCLDNIQCIFVDEAQFLSKTNIDMLKTISMNITVQCYGLRTDYKTNLFEGSRRLFELSDEIIEISRVCAMNSSCLNKAIVNMKYVEEDGKIIQVSDGSDDIDLGAEEKYIGVCWKCWMTKLGETSSKP